MTNQHRRQIIELRQVLHDLTSDDQELQCAIWSTRAALEAITDHPEIDSFIATVRRRTAAILARMNK